MSLSVYDLAVDLTECACSVALVGIDVHSQSKLVADAANYVVKDQRTCGVYAHLYNLAVGYAQSFCFFGTHVNVSLCDDHTAVDGQLTCRTNQLDAGGICNVAALTYGNTGKAECASVREGQLYLVSRTGGAKNADSQRALGADEGSDNTQNAWLGVWEMEKCRELPAK